MFNNDEWLAQVKEEIIDPDREIIDPHHHLWPNPETHYDLEHLVGDLRSGHNVTQTVFMECRSSYLTEGEEHLKPIGETIYVAEAARKSAEISDCATITGIVGHADLTLPELDAILDAHLEAAPDLFKGIRHAGARDDKPDALTIPGRAQLRLYADEAFRKGVQRLGERGLSYDTWHYHHQNEAYYELAQAIPETTFILDHFGTPLGVGDYTGKREEIFARWKDDVAKIAECPNVYAKIGGLAMPDNGFGFHERDLPPSSDEVVELQGRYYHHMISCFGAERCMFESNFPVDRLSLSYTIYWNAMKKIAADYSEAEQEAMFSGTARKVYRL